MLEFKCSSSEIAGMFSSIVCIELSASETSVSSDPGGSCGDSRGSLGPGGMELAKSVLELVRGVLLNILND